MYWGIGVEDDWDDMYHNDDRIKDIPVRWWDAVLLKKELTLNYRDEPSSMKGMIRLLPNFRGRAFRSKENGIINLTMKFTTFNDACVLKLMNVPRNCHFEVFGEIEENYNNYKTIDFEGEEGHKLSIKGLFSYDPSIFGHITDVAQLVISKPGMV